MNLIFALIAGILAFIIAEGLSSDLNSGYCSAAIGFFITLVTMAIGWPVIIIEIILVCILGV